jgi:DNA end-binding protein Ku
MARVIWKGAISFGLVHVPVGLYPASTETGIDFDWLDKRSMDPVGYKRINKRTGREIANEQIVKGIQVEGGDYVVIGDDEIKAAYPKTTQTIEIEAFVQAAEIPFTHLERPYYLEPIGKGEKVYALLREAMLDAGVIGIARVVMHSKEHLAALIPAGPALMLNTLRWASEIRPWDELKLPPAGKKGAQLKESELKMARQLVGDMTTAWKPEQYEDRFTDAIHALVKQRVEAGKTEQVQPLEEGDAPSPSNVVDLSELLAKSLGQRKGRPAAKAARKPPAKTAAAKKPAHRAAAKKRA